MDTSVTQTAPLVFQTLTCKVCQPPGAPTGPSIWSSCQLEVFALLSREYPTALTGREEQELALMWRVKGEETCWPLVGLMITVCAKTGAVARASVIQAQQRRFVRCIENSFIGLSAVRTAIRHTTSCQHSSAGWTVRQGPGTTLLRILERERTSPMLSGLF